MKRLLRPLVRRALRDELPAADIDATITAAFARYASQRTHLPAEPNLGGRLMVRLAALTACLYTALLDQGLDEGEATRLTAKVTRTVFGRMTAFPTRVARTLSRDPRRRVQIALRWMRTFPFGPPAFDMRDVDEGLGVVGLDVRRCPMAEYFRTQGLDHLCVETFCALDFELARSWGARLERTTTLAGGGERCDFRHQV